ncbi:hypothetical protein SUNI508_06787 [Seiridium unicorne]|uniref:2EXR domain-containing protein n=1 Tax=Seiridium unicorne TaxID=138068 RepID=A0ABR2V033_9PEZI
MISTECNNPVPEPLPSSKSGSDRISRQLPSDDSPSSEVSSHPVPLNEMLDSLYADSSDSRFECFSSLPCELRFHIWKTSLKCNQIIYITCLPYSSPPPWRQQGRGGRYSTYNELGKAIGGDRYEHRFQNLPRPALLRRSNRDKSGETCSLYFNPKYDFLSPCIPSLFPHRRHLFFNLLHDIKAYDPRDVGVLNLIVSNVCVPRSVEDGYQESFKATATNLQNLWLHLSFSSSTGHADSFTWLETDPRSIDLDLHRVPLNRLHHIPLHTLWEHIETLFGIKRDQPLDFHYFKCASWAPETDVPAGAGFWLFPSSIAPKVTGMGRVMFSDQYLDLSAHPPQLCVMDLL